MKSGLDAMPLFLLDDLLRLLNNSRLFFCIFTMNFAMATLGLKEMGKFLWEGREKSLPSWLSQFSFAKLVFNFGVGPHASFSQIPVVKIF